MVHPYSDIATPTPTIPPLLLLYYTIVIIVIPNTVAASLQSHGGRIGLNMAVLQQSPGWLVKLSGILGAPEAGLRLFVSLLFGFPIALVHRYALYGKDLTSQHLYFIVSGLALGFWNYEWNILHSVAALFFTYLTLRVFGGTTASVAITFLFNMSYLSYGYFTTSTNDYDIKWTMPQCVLTLRLIGLAFNYADGQKPSEKLSASQKQTVLKDRPSLLEMAAFTYFPGSFLVGPQFSMRRYLDFVNDTLIEKKTGDSSLPDCLVAGLKRAFIGFIYIALFQLGTLYVSDQYLLGPEFDQVNFIKRCFLVGLWGRVNLYKYISCWLIAEGVCITFGLTYNGKDDRGKAKWDGCANVELLLFENATQFNHYILSFNINTNHWCAEYIYKRLKFLGSRILSQVFTLLFLAIWHGFHSGYYVCFLMEFIIMYFEKDIGPVLLKNTRLQTFLEKHLAARIGLWVILKIYTLVFMGYSLIPFVLLSYPKYTQVFASVYYCGHILFFSYPLLAPFIKKLIRERRSTEVRSHQE